MYRILFALSLFSAFVSMSCDGSSPANQASNTNTNRSANANGELKLDPANMPPGLSGSPVPLSANIPGIPVNATPFKKGSTPIPGIPSEDELKKKKKPGTTPTPGIPDEATIRKAMGQPPRNANVRP